MSKYYTLEIEYIKRLDNIARNLECDEYLAFEDN